MYGQYLTIQLSGTGYVQLCEVEAYSTDSYVPPSIGKINVLERTTTNSSTLYNS